MFWDKFSAIRNWWRVSEGALLGWSFLGGALG
ncbi:MAG: DNA-binding protein, partial [Alphaproteobacteria bacterium]